MTNQTNDVRFAFGRNWKRFLNFLTEERIIIAERGLCNMLDLPHFMGQTFLDVGSGSGLFSLAARRLGANVHSFDYDADAVACTEYLKSKFFRDEYVFDDTEWTIQQGSILDRDFVESLGKYDIVYSWGVLHHTGDLRNALENVAILPKVGGKLFLAIYNDKGKKSKLWLGIKRFYCSGMIGKVTVTITGIPLFILKLTITSLLTMENQFIINKESRGMSLIIDWIDWLGGYPYEVASIEKITDFFFQRGFRLDKIRSSGGTSGNNEYVFTRLQ